MKSSHIDLFNVIFFPCLGIDFYPLISLLNLTTHQVMRWNIGMDVNRLCFVKAAKVCKFNKRNHNWPFNWAAARTLNTSTVHYHFPFLITTLTVADPRFPWGFQLYFTKFSETSMKLRIWSQEVVRLEHILNLSMARNTVQEAHSILTNSQTVLKWLSMTNFFSRWLDRQF